MRIRLRPDDIASLVRKAAGYMADAELLFGEGRYDSAVSRIYYAMFYCAEAALLTVGKQYSRHQGVISGFGRYFVRAGIFRPEMHGWLAEAFSERNLADYAPGSVLDRERAALWLERGREFVRQVEEYLHSRGFLETERPGPV